jgi:Phytanoyl-CoA dioxygenase (PhyH)
MLLTDTELSSFRRDGVIIRRGAVPEDTWRQALDLIEANYPAQASADQIAAYTKRTFTPQLERHPTLLRLLTESAAWPLACDLLGQVAPVEQVQIQIRIPESDAPGSQPIKAMHVDGVACPHLDPDELRTFSLLVGIPLTDVRDRNAGALHYLPGGHHEMASWFATEWSLGMTKQTPPEIDIQGGTPFLAETGDLLLMHHLVPHRVGTNNAQTPRIAAYFRLSHPGLATHRLQALSDPWLDYPRLAASSTDPASERTTS